VACHNNIGAAFVDAVDFFLKYAARDVRILDREQPPKSAASLGALQLNHLNSFDRFEQPLRFGPYLKLTQQMTRLMQRYLTTITRAYVLDAKDIDDKLSELVRSRSERFGAAMPVRIVFEKLRIENLHHARAGTGGRNDVFGSLEDLDEPLR